MTGRRQQGNGGDRPLADATPMRSEAVVKIRFRGLGANDNHAGPGRAPQAWVTAAILILGALAAVFLIF